MITRWRPIRWASSLPAMLAGRPHDRDQGGDHPEATVGAGRGGVLERAAEHQQRNEPAAEREHLEVVQAVDQGKAERRAAGQDRSVVEQPGPRPALGPRRRRDQGQRQQQPRQRAGCDRREGRAPAEGGLKLERDQVREAGAEIVGRGVERGGAARASDRQEVGQELQPRHVGGAEADPLEHAPDPGRPRAIRGRGKAERGEAADRESAREHALGVEPIGQRGAESDRAEHAGEEDAADPARAGVADRPGVPEYRNQRREGRKRGHARDLDHADQRDQARRWQAPRPLQPNRRDPARPAPIAAVGAA
jgi:hypothetical protein